MDLANGRADAPNGGDAEEATVTRKNAELVPEAVNGLLGENKSDGHGEAKSLALRQLQEEDQEEGLLSSLHTKLDAVERDPADSGISEPHRLHPNNDDDHHHQPGTGRGEDSKEADLAEIAKDLGKIKRQNTITHLLLGAVIVLTAVWQVNEVSFLLWVQSKLSNPFKSLWDMLRGSLKLKGRKPVMIESSPLPPVGVPNLSRTDLPSLVIGSTGDR